VAVAEESAMMEMNCKAREVMILNDEGELLVSAILPEMPSFWRHFLWG
jgi:hypothetical protein